MASTPIVDDAINVYVGDNGAMNSFNDHGQPRWRTPVIGTPMSAQFTSDGNVLLVSAAVAAGIAAVSATVVGLGLLLGPAGIGLGAVLMLFVSNPISGLATGPAWLPQPWGEIGQYLPIGAAGTAMRSAAYFDGGGATQAWIVLACWIVGGILLAVGGARRGGGASQNADTAS